MELDLSRCLIARKGEVITCPDCLAELAEFLFDAYFSNPECSLELRGAGGILAATGGLICRRCGGNPAPSGGDTEQLHEAPRPQVHLSTGWRELGGEAA